MFEALLALTVALGLLVLVKLISFSPGSWTHLQYVIAEDIWRVLYLRHGLGMFYPVNASTLKEDLDKISKEVGVCVEYETPTFSYSSKECPAKSGNVVAVSEDFTLGKVVLKVGK